MTVPPFPFTLRSKLADGLFWLSAGLIHTALWICPEKTGD
jgi:hypothetical protein